MKKIAALCLVTMLALTGLVAVAQTRTELMAGQDIPVGKVVVSNNATTLTVIFATTDAWFINETHVAVAGDAADIPQKNGNPIPGKFDYKAELDSPVQTCTIEIPLDGLSGDVVIAAHAEVAHVNETGVFDQEETAWAAGKGFTGKNWATYFTYTIEIEEEP